MKIRVVETWPWVGASEDKEVEVLEIVTVEDLVKELHRLNNVRDFFDCYVEFIVTEEGIGEIQVRHTW